LGAAQLRNTQAALANDVVQSAEARYNLASFEGLGITGVEMKIFQIGFNRCGTTTIHYFMQKNGIASVHWDEGRLARCMFANLAASQALLASYEHFHVFTDMEFIDGNRYLEAYKLFPHLAAQYPDSVFILNTRDREAWVRSRLRHLDGRYAAIHRAYFGAKSDRELASLWRAEWDRHHRAVLDFFAGTQYRFFVWPIETDLPSLLKQEIPELDLEVRHYKRRNVAASIRRSMARRTKGARKLLKHWSGSLLARGSRNTNRNA
jgi:hypothetical protein